MTKRALIAVSLFAIGAFASACMTDEEDGAELDVAESDRGTVTLTAGQLESNVQRFERGTIVLDNQQSARLTVSTDPGAGGVFADASVEAICTDGEHVLAQGRAFGEGNNFLDLVATCASNHIVSVSDATVRLDF